MNDFSKLSWHYVNDDLVKAKISWLGDFRASTNVFYHAIEIITDRIRKYVTRHTINIACGAYGEIEQ